MYSNVKNSLPIPHVIFILVFKFKKINLQHKIYNISFIYIFSTRSSSKYTQDETTDSYEFGGGL